ncbi:MAG: RNA polymerase sporulation sigma factor SigF [Clostridiales bacterium]|nr:RNA polymerase sporulation sigma factor SigF [Clostridiales bacterium]
MGSAIELIKKARKGDAESKEALIKENMGLIWSVVKRFSNRGYETDDLFQIGAIGLLKCINKFDESFGVKFSTYAIPMIVGEIKRFIRDDGMIKVSRPLKEIAIKARYIQDDMIKKNGAPPTISQLAEAVGVTVEDLVMAMNANKDVESLYSVVYQSDGAPVYLIDKLAQSVKSDDNMADYVALKNIINDLNPKERQIVIMRYFYDKTQMEIAKTIGVSQVQVSRIEKKALKSIRDNFDKR